MSLEAQLFLLKAAHTLIVAFNAAGIAYILYCGWRNRFDVILWAAIMLSAGIALGLLINDFVCPLQSLARRLVGTEGWAPDLFMPNWSAYLIVPVLGPLMAVGYALVGWRLVQRRRRRKGGAAR